MSDGDDRDVWADAWWTWCLGHAVDASAATSWANQGAAGEALDLAAPEPPSEPEDGR